MPPLGCRNLWFIGYTSTEKNSNRPPIPCGAARFPLFPRIGIRIHATRRRPIVCRLRLVFVCPQGLNDCREFADSRLSSPAPLFFGLESFGPAGKANSGPLARQEGKFLSSWAPFPLGCRKPISWISFSVVAPVYDRRYNGRRYGRVMRKMSASALSTLM